ncbi:hypothetical protein R5R35_013200 [Gryllus longicercus]|uniref:Uncharacterized protein n=1 Tax=Gryllus longicercus TaxID=2509291 RepID=A0AAN9ZHX2_9ORTH
MKHPPSFPRPGYLHVMIWCCPTANETAFTNSHSAVPQRSAGPPSHTRKDSRITAVAAGGRMPVEISSVALPTDRKRRPSFSVTWRRQAGGGSAPPTAVAALLRLSCAFFHWSQSSANRPTIRKHCREDSV